MVKVRFSNGLNHSITDFQNVRFSNGFGIRMFSIRALTVFEVMNLKTQLIITWSKGHCCSPETGQRDIETTDQVDTILLPWNKCDKLSQVFNIKSNSFDKFKFQTSKEVSSHFCKSSKNLHHLDNLIRLSETSCHWTYIDRVRLNHQTLKTL